RPIGARSIGARSIGARSIGARPIGAQSIRARSNPRPVGPPASCRLARALPVGFTRSRLWPLPVALAPPCRICLDCRVLIRSMGS
ncbi:hypothetical protein, partial [Micromonospora zamorensis]|uniref:hypothetical protein n=1 Tax=Micromonospora zamorensis TaxID=709883 RepID=UPI0033B0D3BB